MVGVLHKKLVNRWIELIIMNWFVLADVIDIVNDQLSGSDYKKEEDPSIYASKKNGRGPLTSDWITNPQDGIIMCAYKLIKVQADK